MAEIVLEHLRKEYENGAVAVENVDLVIEDGEFVVLVGPSGCGKSTTLHMIAGLESITSGELRIGGKRVNEVAPKDRDIAMVFQSYALYPHMTVRQNIAFPLTLRKVAKKDIAQHVGEVAKILDLDEVLDRKPGQLSGGQRQRVAMGRAIVRQPKAFLMDEPLSNLDAKLRVQMRAELVRLRQRLHTTTVYVTHDQTEAMTLGDRVVVMKGGVVQQVSGPQELYDHPKNRFVAEFIGSPSMNFVQGELRGEVLHTEWGDSSLSPQLRSAIMQRANNQRIVLGVRPEHVEDATEGAGAEGEMEFSGEVMMVESVGSHRYVTFSAGKENYVARVAAHSRAKVGEVFPWRCAVHKAQFFDADSGENLLLSGG